LAGAYQQAYNIGSVELGIIGVNTNALPTRFTEVPVVMDIVAEWVDSNLSTDRANNKRGVLATVSRLFKDPAQKRSLASFMLKRMSALGPNGQNSMAKMAVAKTAEANPGMDTQSDQFIELAKAQYRTWLKESQTED
jgi:hypothetical protein